ncbi:MAG: hypothetical protein H6807_06030 [Planctomycetes bacterium]|nr:hypothetical protein [Planctomycetota bacterium]
MNPGRALVITVAVVASATPGRLAAQDQVIKDDRPLRNETQPDRDLTADDFRDRGGRGGVGHLELILGCLFLVLVLVVAGIRRERRPR